MRRPLHHLVGGVAGVEIRKDKDRRAAGDRAVRGFLASDTFDAGGGVLQWAIDQQLRALGVSKRQCADDLVQLDATAGGPGGARPAKP
jgi:hypothetical protein